jgi:hypothetical protein
MLETEMRIRVSQDPSHTFYSLKDVLDRYTQEQVAEIVNRWCDFRRLAMRGQKQRRERQKELRRAACTTS